MLKIPLAALCLLFIATRAFGAPAFAEIFSDRMVLQREMPLPVWGSAAPGESLRVSFGEQSVDVCTDKEGRWRVVFAPFKASAEPRELRVEGPSGAATAKDVLVGEVWICAGQSNMQWPLDEKHGVLSDEAALTAENRPLLRHRNSALAFKGPWLSASPKAPDSFSAVPYFFSRALQDALDGVPVGVVNLSYSGTNIETWTPEEALAETDWGRKLLAFSKSQAIDGWRKARAEKSRAAEMPPAIKYFALEDLYNLPANFHDKAVRPVAGFAIRGFAWYQGENNAQPPKLRLEAYAKTLELMIAAWRKEWGRDDAPFLCVQLPGIGRFAQNGYEAWSYWAALRDQQTRAAKNVPGVSLAAIFDTPEGESANLHPRRKLEVGERLARLALRDVYGKDLAASGPTFKAMRRDGARLLLSFANADGGLKLEALPTTGFMIAGADKRFLKAEAKIEGSELALSSTEVREPVAVRYAWANRPFAALFNGAGLPAAPFRTDDWPLVELGDLPAPQEAAMK